MADTTAADEASKLTAKLYIDLNAEEYENVKLTPWFTYRVNLPVKPIPSLSERPHIKTERLVIRPIVLEDLEKFHALRSIPETQNYSPSRGRADRDIEETRLNIEKLQPPHDQSHWYFGAFLISTGEMIGEAGFVDCDHWLRSGWPEVEILIKPLYWRQGYGTELLSAFLQSWWDLPRAVRNHQLLPVVYGDREPGSRVKECVSFLREHGIPNAAEFLAKVLAPYELAAVGSAVDVDHRDTRVGSLVRWTATLVINPNDKLEAECPESSSSGGEE